MRRSAIGVCVGLLAIACLGLGCSGDGDNSASATPTPVVSVTQSPATTSSAAAPTGTRSGPSTPGPNATLPAGVIPGATPSTNYMPLPPGLQVTPTIFPPGPIRGAAATSFTPEPRRTSGGPTGGTPPAWGAVEGQLIYPSEGIPPSLIVCAESLDWGESYCTNSRVDRPGAPAGSSGGYLLPLPAGRFLVFSIVPPGLKRAYYSYFVPCGLHVNCPSHDPIVVIVRPGQLLTDVNPGDWYVPPP